MQDTFGRSINYMRISVTDRCNLRCRYCAPDGGACVQADGILTDEEILRTVRAAVSTGITRFKVTGGEPLMRPGCADLLRRLKAIPGVQSVTLTTNGTMLAPLAKELAAFGLDGVNISLDAPERAEYARIAGADRLLDVLAGLDAALAAGLRTKLNCVLLPGCEARLVPLARFAAEKPLDVRFIEVMPIGAGREDPGPDRDKALAILRTEWPGLHAVNECRGNGPAHYYADDALMGRIGMIDAVSHRFCENCNRIRLTCTGLLKPCLCYGESVDLRGALHSGSEEDLRAALCRAVAAKPRAHCFEDRAGITERRGMSEIGG